MIWNFNYFNKLLNGAQTAVSLQRGLWAELLLDLNRRRLVIVVFMSRRKTRSAFVMQIYINTYGTLPVYLTFDLQAFNYTVMYLSWNIIEFSLMVFFFLFVFFAPQHSEPLPAGSGSQTPMWFGAGGGGRGGTCYVHSLLLYFIGRLEANELTSFIKQQMTRFRPTDWSHAVVSGGGDEWGGEEASLWAFQEEGEMSGNGGLPTNGQENPNTVMKPVQ